VSPRLRTGLALAGSFALGGGLLYVALRGADLGAVGAALRGGAWGWLVPLAAATVLSVVIRAWRWTLLLDTLPQTDGAPQADRTPLSVAVASVLIGYLVNLAVPRLGEVVRAGNVAAKRPVGFAAIIGTVVAERLLDVAMLALALVAVTLLFGQRLGAVAAEAALGFERLLGSLPGTVEVLLGVGVLVVVAVLVALLVRSRRRDRTPGRLAGLGAQFRDGALALVRTGRPAGLAVSTLAIWACYAAMSWFPLQILGMAGDYGLGAVDAFALMTVGAVGMTLPAPGGAGSFHYATIQTLVLLFAVPVSPATSYAVLGHAAQLLFYAVAGVAALVWQGTGIRAATQVAREQAVSEPPPRPHRPGPRALATEP
jgi:hypothetical protein